MIIKVCGMKEGDNIRQVEELGVNLLGFIFYPKSPRYVTSLPHYLPNKARRVGVFVNETKENVRMYADRFSLDYIQLHGSESPDYCRSLLRNNLKLIKAFSVSDVNDLNKVTDYEGLCELYIFDTKTSDYGGSGKQFNWSVLNSYQGKTSFLLSGGISPESIQRLKKFAHPQLAGYDLNSCFEISAGMKNVELIKHFLMNIK